MARLLEGSVRIRGKPTCLVSDTGTGVSSKATLTWANETGIKVQDIVPGKFRQKGYIASFDGSLRRECLSRRNLRQR